MAASAAAATITWREWGVVGSEVDVRTNGALVGALELGGGSAKVVNGVTFAADPGGASVGNISFFALESSYSDFIATPSINTYMEALDTGRVSSGINGGVTFSGLTVGNLYQVQLWLTDTQSQRSTFKSYVSAAGGGGVLTLNGAGLTDPQWAVFTFTADGSASQSFSLNQSNLNPSFAGAQLNLIQIRDITVPEPTAAVLGAGALLAGTGRRRRGASRSSR